MQAATLQTLRMRDSHHGPSNNETERKKPSQTPENNHTGTNVEHSTEVWEVTNEWTYMGHGEWALLDEGMSEEQSCKGIETEPEWIFKWWCTTDEDVRLHNEVLKGGYPNRWGARRPVTTRWNLELLEELLIDYEDKEVVEWIKFGWPVGRLPTLQEPAITNKNHKGATEHPQALRQYIHKEQAHGAIMGPFNRIPFQSKVGISPLSTRPKK